MPVPGFVAFLVVFLVGGVVRGVRMGLVTLTAVLGVEERFALVLGVMLGDVGSECEVIKREARTTDRAGDGL